MKTSLLKCGEVFCTLHYVKQFCVGLFVVGLMVRVAPLSSYAQTPITIDGSFTDWTNVPIIYSSPPGTGAPGQIDFGQLQITNDQSFLFLRIELGKDVILQESNLLRLYIDTDSNSSTGTLINGIGAELIWYFGDRNGTVRLNGQTTSILHTNITLRTGPTVSSTVFELCVSRSAQFNGQSLFANPAIRVLFRDGTNGDMLPLAGQQVQYTFQAGSIPTDLRSITKLDTGDLRVMSWNILNDGLWNSTQAPRFGRILSATKPDIINFQEVNNHTAAETVSVVSGWYTPSNPSGPWYTASNTDCKTLSRYPILNSWALSTGDIAMLINTGTVFDRPLLLINAHLKCCSDADSNTTRQSQIDRILSFVRDAKTPGGLLTLAADTPILITGDLNLVSYASQLNSLLTGQIFNQAAYGPSFAPDWNGDPFFNLYSQHSDQRAGYSWFSSTSTYTAGLLDYQIYTDSVLDAAHHFIVNTQAMSSQRLASHGLQLNDSLASDHLAFIADYRIDTPDPSFVVGGFVYHNGWTGFPSTGPWDAIDPQKIVARQGLGPLNLDMNNLINSAHGINGLVFDVQGLWNPTGLSANDFQFQMSPQGPFDPIVFPATSWILAPNPNFVSASTGSPNRVLIKWPNNAMANRWLRVTLLATENTGLPAPVVFYIGHMLGETTGVSEGYFNVSVADIFPIRDALATIVNPGSSVDIDKNGQVAVADIIAMRANLAKQLTAITIP